MAWPNCHIQAFADDIILVTKSKTIDQPQQLTKEAIDKNSHRKSVVTWGFSLVQNPTARISRKLNSLQRGFLLSISGAYSTTPTTALQVILTLPPLPLKLKFEAGITTIARLNKPFQNSEGLLPLDVELVEVGWVKHPSIFLHENRISLEDGGIFYPKSGIFTDGSKTTSVVGAAFWVLKDNLVSYQWSAKPKMEIN
ncbi:hypothetical protein AVEN_62842-1 [Araneus ventricosus]|uniref:Reverse transcriptase domain-containing protein n=1 Tax=Araneus ventricosus TaxID=182803 RepID=A0A4Y2U225_ARAVE|nr:hypothetical protein AVEN_62842-1 [Araneus ventricosus]